MFVCKHWVFLCKKIRVNYMFSFYSLILVNKIEWKRLKIGDSI